MGCETCKIFSQSSEGHQEALAALSSLSPSLSVTLCMGTGPPCQHSPGLIPAGLRCRLAVPSPDLCSFPHQAEGPEHPGHSHVPSLAWPHLLHEPQSHVVAMSLLLLTGLWTWHVILPPPGLWVVPASHYSSPNQSSPSERACCCPCCACPQLQLALPHRGSTV